MSIPYGPDNPHPLSKLKTELVWEGKYDEYGNLRPVRLPDCPIPLQRIETVDAPSDAARAIAARQGDLFDQVAFTQSSHCDDFRNMLIWGDNKLALGALLDRFRGGVDLIYVDPPFDVGADFTMSLPVGNDEQGVAKEQSLMEAVAYRDTWGKGTDSYLQMMYERLVLAKELLKSNGSIYVHCDWRVDYLLRNLLQHVFGSDTFKNEVIWHYLRWPAKSPLFQRSHDVIYWFGRSSQHKWNQQYQELSEATLKRFGGMKVKGETTKEVLNEESLGAPMRDVWEIPHVLGANPERLDYPTQKPERLLERIISANTVESDVVLDFFCGSGTSCAVAEKLGRRWIGIDLGRYAVHTTRKRLIGVQRTLHAEGKPYRSFDLYNLGRYERQWWQLDRLRGANEEHRATVLKFFRAQPLMASPSPLLHGNKGGAFVHVDDIDSLLTLEELESVVKAALDAGGRAVTCLAWEFQMDLKTKAQALEAKYNLKIALKYIPREIMEPNRSEVQFFEAAALSAEAFVSRVDNDQVFDVKLTGFIPSLSEVPEKELDALRERAVNSPFDFIDFWAVDFEHLDGKPFEHHWQDFRTRKDRRLLTTSNCRWKYATPGKKQIRIKVIDVFGIDTTKVIEVTV